MKSCILVGGGYSVKEGIELGLWDKIKGQEIWSLNYAYKFIPYLPSRQLWVDLSFFKNNINDLQKLQEQGVSLYTKDHPLYKEKMYRDKITSYELTRKWKEHTDKIYVGSSLGLVGNYALSLAFKEKYDIIYLLGYDFGTKASTDLNTHFYVDVAEENNIKSSGLKRPGVYYQDGKNSIKNDVLDFDNYKTIYGSKVYNVSMDSNLHSFEKISYQEFFNILEKK